MTNLLEILAACTGVSTYAAADSVGSYAELKERAAEAVIEELAPVRENARAFLEDPAELDRIRANGALRASERGAPRLEAALRLSGLR